MFYQYRLALVHFEEAIHTEKSPLAIPRHNIGYSNYYLATELESKSGRRANYEQIEEMYHEAIKYFDQAIKIELRLYQSWYYKGRVCYIGLRQYDKALKTYDISLQINPKFPLAWYDKGRIYAKLERYEEAIECYENARKLSKHIQTFFLSSSSSIILPNRTSQKFPSSRSNFIASTSASCMYSEIDI